jgi:Predicted membrane protein
MKTKGKAKSATASTKKAGTSKTKGKDEPKSRPAQSRYEIVFELPVRVRAESREAAALLAARWLTDTLLKAERPAAIRVSPPQKAAPASSQAPDAADATTDAEPPAEPPAEPTAVVTAAPAPAEPDNPPAEPVASEKSEGEARPSRKSRKAATARNGASSA